MSGDFIELRDQIRNDAKAEPDLIFIIDEGADYICFEDLDQDSTRFTIFDKDSINTGWIEDRIIMSPASETICPLSKSVLSEWILSHIPKETYMFLNRIIFLTDDDNDVDAILEEETSDASMADLMAVHSLPSDDQLGISWVCDNCVVLDISHIKRCIDEMYQEGCIDDVKSEMEYGILMTLAHELRHLQQNFPYPSDRVFDSFLPDPEEDAEEFARKCLGRGPGFPEKDL